MSVLSHSIISFYSFAFPLSCLVSIVNQNRFFHSYPIKIRCLDESWALNEKTEGKDCGSLAEAGLAYGGAQATLRAAKRLLYLQYETIGGRQASRESMEVGVEKRLLVVHRWTLFQKLSILLSTEEFGVRRSAPYVSMGRRRPLAMRWHRKGLTPAPGEDKRLTKEKIAWARESLCLK